MRVLHLLLAAAVALASCYPAFDETVDCDAWCTNLDRHCDAVSADTPECVRLCEAGVFGEGGEYGASTGNTVACRLEHAYRAGETSEAADVEAACSAAGPSGGGVCGDLQEVWCGIGLAVCGPDAELLPPEPTFQLATPWRDGAAGCAAVDTNDVDAGQFAERAADLARARVHARQGDWSGFANCCQEAGTDEPLGCALD